MALTDGLVSYWALDEASGTRYDSHGANDLTDVGVVASAAGIVGDAALFNGDNLENTSPAGLGNQDVSWQMWFNLTAIDEFDALGRMSNGGWTIGYGWYFTAADRLRFWVEGYNANFVETTTAFSLNAWHHVVGTYDSTANELKVYANGSLEATASADVTLTFSGAALMLNAFNIRGKIDESGVWSRALSAGEVSSLYNGGAALAYPLAGGGGGGAVPKGQWYYRLIH